MDYEKLTIYIKDALARGVTEDSIRSQLVQSGCPPHVADLALERVAAQQDMDLKKTGAKKSHKLRNIIIAIVCLLLLGAGTLLLQNKGPSEAPQQNYTIYQPQSKPPGWETSTIQYDGKTFDYNRPADWVVDDASTYTSPGGKYTDTRIITPDFKDADNLDDGYIILKGAAVNIQIAKYSGDIDTYKDEVKSGQAAPVLALGYSDLKQTVINGRSVLSYVRKTNYVKTVALVDRGYLVIFEYLQPYKQPQANGTPEFEDAYLSQLNDIIASFHQK